MADPDLDLLPEFHTDVRRFDKGSRIPGWDRAADLDKEPAEIPDPADTEVPDELRAVIEAEMARFPDYHSAAIPALFAVQARYGWCSPEGIRQAACVMGVTPAYLTSIATFYDMFNTEPLGRRQVYVCTNISCSLCGADELLAMLQEELTGNEQVNLRSFECLGACDIAPMASVDGVYVGPVPFDEVPELARQIAAGEDPLPERQLVRRPCADPRAAGPAPRDGEGEPR
ncbi:MAG: NAD(P)H-dependent oxidoreductase subunit E [Solirubrobacterales bacterium]